jgi:hypothetical protein
MKLKGRKLLRLCERPHLSISQRMVLMTPQQQQQKDMLSVFRCYDVLTTVHVQRSFRKALTARCSVMDMHLSCIVHSCALACAIALLTVHLNRCVHYLSLNL